MIGGENFAGGGEELCTIVKGNFTFRKYDAEQFADSAAIIA